MRLREKESRTPFPYFPANLCSSRYGLLLASFFPPGCQSYAEATYKIEEMCTELPEIFAYCCRPVSMFAAQIISRTDGDLSACVRSTTVVTELEVSPPGRNVIPALAKAIVNFRLLPGTLSSTF